MPGFDWCYPEAFVSQPFNIDPRWEIATVLFHCVKIVDCKIVVKLGYSSICQHIELF